MGKSFDDLPGQVETIIYFQHILACENWQLKLMACSFGYFCSTYLAKVTDLYIYI